MTHLWTFKIGLETSQVTQETIQQEIIVGVGKFSVDQDCWVDRGSQRVVRERIRYVFQRLGSVVPSNEMTARVHPYDILGASRGNLDIVFGIPPAAESGKFVIVKRCRVLNIERIWEGIVQFVESLRKFWGLTEGPIPVRCRSGVTAFISQGVFEV